MPHQLAAFYQCYGQPKSFLRTLGSFRYHYPSGTVKLISDGGLSFEKAAKCFECDYELAERIGCNRGTYFSTPDQLIKWLTRLVVACKKMNEEYVIILEDDVRILKHVSQLGHDLNGMNRGAWLGEKLTKFLRDERKNETMGICNDHNYGGCGGSVLRRQFIVDNFDTMKTAVAEISQYAKGDLEGPYPSDYYLSALILYFGGSIREYNGYCEKSWPNYEGRRALGEIEVLHQEKSLYHDSLEPWEAAILGWITVGVQVT